MIGRRHFYPDFQPHSRGRLPVSAVHELYYEESGNPHGKPAVVLHGGPGGGISPFLRQMHDPRAYRIITFDQRGCGHSTPYASLEDNTTWDLVADMERLREHLNIDRWQVVGGSWGSTLALAYAETHPDRVSELVVRGIFTVRKQEIDWFYQHGADALYPDAWEGFLAPIPADERHALVNAYHRRLTGTDEATLITCARVEPMGSHHTLAAARRQARRRVWRRPFRHRLRADRVPLFRSSRLLRQRRPIARECPQAEGYSGRHHPGPL